MQYPKKTENKVKKGGKGELYSVLLMTSHNDSGYGNEG